MTCYEPLRKHCRHLLIGYSFGPNFCRPFTFSCNKMSFEAIFSARFIIIIIRRQGLKAEESIVLFDKNCLIWYPSPAAGGSTATLTIIVITQFIISKRKDVWNTDVNLLIVFMWNRPLLPGPAAAVIIKLPVHYSQLKIWLVSFLPGWSCSSSCTEMIFPKLVEWCRSLRISFVRFSPPQTFFEFSIHFIIGQNRTLVSTYWRLAVWKPVW